MSLKAFHVLFIMASIVCLGFYGGWSCYSYKLTTHVMDLIMGVLAIIFLIALLIYFRKFRDVTHAY